MSNKFLHIVSSAQENKRQFDLSVGFVKDSLQETVATAHCNMQHVSFPTNKIQTTGWLKGALSYPWVIVCSIIPAVVEMLV